MFALLNLLGAIMFVGALLFIISGIAGLAVWFILYRDDLEW